ncbi:MAG: AbrB/MazE/SpoVT family DNA-binding domain-containing protein [Gemmatimonadetes bacterium]|nr:AbrB/MazE/SpoVT family DNA-binding domain-containing protein [Gemmatimonadota bacterium]
MANPRAKLFWNGRSQAVRLPQEFRFEGDEVEIRREGELVVLAPVARRRFDNGYWQELDTLAAGIDLGDAEPAGGRLLDLDLDAPDE